jgi:hypothetical protein
MNLACVSGFDTQARMNLKLHSENVWAWDAPPPPSANAALYTSQVIPLLNRLNIIHELMSFRAWPSVEEYSIWGQ